MKSKARKDELPHPLLPKDTDTKHTGTGPCFGDSVRLKRENTGVEITQHFITVNFPF